jgi:DNA-binding HxlR family transcriptional regulator
MHKNTQEAIIKYLRDYYLQKGSHYYKDFHDLRRALPHIQPKLLEVSLNYLKKEGLINFITGYDAPVGITLTPAGLSYFDRD